MSPLPDTLVRFRTELEEAIRREQKAHASARNGRVARLIGRRPRRIALAFGVLAGAAVAALFVSTPWQSSSGFSLERAAAALTPPPESILHVRWETTSTRGPACTFVNEVWIDQTPPHTYRAILPMSDPAAASAHEPACPTASEFGGELGKEGALRFVPPNTLSIHPGRLYFQLDPVADLRTAISEGRARREGTTELDGRTVERVRFDPPSPLPRACRIFGCPPGYGYFDPESLEPVAFDFGQGDIWRYLEFDFVTRTDENLALTDIRAQHPDATGP